ncbi:hypothetical protein SHAL103562_14710 [Shewanella algae]|uniref:Uncharacterized protein n=1 Tax=Shewanella algae TaxID=38313 RepID=A0A380BRA6_9GAMM|nr:Uncharacterised protein [Shewanella algae]
MIQTDKGRSSAPCFIGEILRSWIFSERKHRSMLATPL